MSDRINWLKDTDGKYRKSLRGYTAEITVNANGTTTLITNLGEIDEDTTEHPNLRAAKNAFRKFLFDKPVA